MSELDVTNLDQGPLVDTPFPAEPKAMFRLYFAPDAHEGILQHAEQNLSVEICGILVGAWRKDANGPYAVVEDYIRCESATSKFAEVTFTHESWAKINDEMDSRFEDKRIVGWYHSHPDFGIFLSERDCFIHEHFFSGAGQVAFVVDPVRQLEGIFAWKDGKPTPMRHYWVGDAITTVQASVSNSVGLEKKSLAPPDEIAEKPASEARSYVVPLTSLLLGSLALFLLGYLLSNWQRDWERQAVVDGVVANYTNFKLAKFGLREELTDVQNQLAAITQLLGETPVITDKVSTEDQENLKKVRKLILSNLRNINQALGKIGNRYAFSDHEMRALSRMQQQMETETQRLRQALPIPLNGAPTTSDKLASHQSAAPTSSEAEQSSASSQD